jgi:hypothetical protein
MTGRQQWIVLDRSGRRHFFHRRALQALRGARVIEREPLHEIRAPAYA